MRFAGWMIGIVVLLLATEMVKTKPIRTPYRRVTTGDSGKILSEKAGVMLKESYFRRFSVRADRKLQPSDRACNEKIGIVTTDELEALVEIFMAALLTPPLDSFIPVFRNLFLQSVTYNLTIYKVCGGCQDYEEVIGDEPFCNSTSIGYDATHSAIVFIPMNSEVDQEILLEVKFRGYIQMSVTEINVEGALSEVWPANLTEETVNRVQLGEAEIGNFLGDMIDLLPLALAASAGAISIGPDGLGCKF